MSRQNLIFVLDTSVLLAAGAVALTVFQEHEVVIPLIVIKELEGKRNDPDIGWLARQVLRRLEELRLTADADGKTLSDGVGVNDLGGTVRVELNHAEAFDELPESLRLQRSNDMRIVAVARALEADHPDSDVVLVSRDLPMRLVAGGVLGLRAEDYLNDQVIDTGYTGVDTITVTADTVNLLFSDSTSPVLLPVGGIPVNTGVIVQSDSGPGSALAVVVGEDSVSHQAQVRRVHERDCAAFGLRAHSGEQRFALRHLLDEEVAIVSLGGRAGTGKTVMALAAGLEAVMERRTQKRVIVFRPLYAVGGQDLGFLPGTEAEKMDPWKAAVFDALQSFCSTSVIDEIVDRKVLEILPLTHIRGRTLHDSFVIVDEAQSLERPVLLTALSRLGNGSKVVLCHDVAQRDNRFVGRHDGVAAVVEKLVGHPIFAHVTLTRSERSRVADVVTTLLDDGCM